MNKIDPRLLDQILCCECVEGMSNLPYDCIDLTLTSEPYGKLRDYRFQGVRQPPGPRYKRDRSSDEGRLLHFLHTLKIWHQGQHY